MRISDWSSDVCSSDLSQSLYRRHLFSSHSLKKQETIMAGDTLIMTLDGGDVVIKLRPDLAPKRVEQITASANEGFIEGSAFHDWILVSLRHGATPTAPGRVDTQRTHLPPHSHTTPTGERISSGPGPTT